MPQDFCKPTDDPRKVRLFHICHLSTFASIVADHALLPLNALRQQGKLHRSIARESLQIRRDEVTISCGLKGNLHDYVPFYFAARSPMLGSISRDEFELQNEIVTLVSAVGSMQKAGCSCVFSDGHPVAVRLSQFFDDLRLLPGVLDWETLLSSMWNDTANFPDRMRKRQAEFLVHSAVPWSAINGIAVRTPEARGSVQTILANSLHQPTLALRPEWYYDK